ncbi:MAG: sigma factor, ECF-like family protein, partial [bacterium]|nr:sigma factor, ECF-like family protein [bacterium]
EIAEVLDVTSRTVKRDWRDARLWLHRELET